VIFAENKLKIAHFGYSSCIPDSPSYSPKGLHFISRLQVEFLALKPHTIGTIYGLSGLNAEKHILDARIILLI
jgi:hypothetical protein